jgi:hypothetical protein
MRLGTSSGLAAALAVLGLGLTGPAASACQGWCGPRYAPAYYGPPAYSYVPPTVVYAGPPVWAYSYFSPAFGARAAAWAYGPTYFDDYYTARVNVFRGPRWNYDAAYYNSPPVYRRAAAYRIHRPHRAYIRGPIVRTWGRR